MTDVHTFITEVSKSVVTIADQDEILFGLLESARTDICLRFLSVPRRQTSDATWSLLTQACSGVAVQMCKPRVDSENPKTPVTRQMSAASEQLLLLVSVPSQYQIFFLMISSIRPS